MGHSAIIRCIFLAVSTGSSAASLDGELEAGSESQLVQQFARFDARPEMVRSLGPRKSPIALQIMLGLIMSPTVGFAFGVLGAKVCPGGEELDICPAGAVAGYAIGAVGGAVLATSLGAHILERPALPFPAALGSLLMTGGGLLVLDSLGGSPSSAAWLVWAASPLVGALVGYHIGLAVSSASEARPQSATPAVQVMPALAPTPHGTGALFGLVATF